MTHVLAAYQHQDSTSLCGSKHEGPGLLEGFRLASTNIALGTQIKNNSPLHYQSQSLELQTSTPKTSPENST